MKKKHRRLILLLIIIIIIIAGVFYVLNLNKDTNLNEVKVVSKIDGYKYQLTARKTALYKGYFKDLRRVLEKDEIDNKEYATLVTKLFIADFYDLNSKVSKNDIGGLEFIYPKALDNFKLNAMNTMYKYVESDVYKDRKQTLPVVKTVVVDSIEPVEQIIDDKPYDGYEVKATWTYKRDLGYETKGVLQLAKVDKYYYIIKTD